jgi:F-type H+-transporting ATPase subunit gamma
MASPREVRNRISGVKKTQKITRAMKMVAAAKLRRSQNAVVAARPYANTMERLLRDVAGKIEGPKGPLLTDRPVERVTLVVVTSDRGLCGAFNSNIIKAAVAHLEENHPGWAEDGRARVVCIGKKAADFFGKRRFTVAGKHIGVSGAPTLVVARSIAGDLIRSFLSGETDRIDLVYNEFKTVAQQKIVIAPFLPVIPEAASGGERSVEYIYEPVKERILDELVPRHLNFAVWRALLESNASEQGARMTAMENATVNANEMIRALQLQYNKARQASITKELLEIVSGAEALR